MKIENIWKFKRFAVKCTAWESVLISGLLVSFCIYFWVLASVSDAFCGSSVKAFLEPFSLVYHALYFFFTCTLSCYYCVFSDVTNSQILAEEGCIK